MAASPEANDKTSPRLLGDVDDNDRILRLLRRAQADQDLLVRLVRRRVGAQIPSKQASDAVANDRLG